MEHWKIEKQKAEAKRVYNLKYPLLGRKVKRGNEEGVIVLDKGFDNDELEYFIQYTKKGDLEGLHGLPFELWDDNKNKWEN